VRRIAQTCIVALLTFSASGVYAFAIAEPCDSYQQPLRDNDACPPMCATCGCCAQAVEPVTVSVAVSPDTPVAAVAFLLPPLPSITPRDILHVPKPRSA
jgi:hypothetical protein